MPSKLAVSKSLASIAAIAALSASFWIGKDAGAREAEARVKTLLASSTTITGETLVYPTGTPKVTAIVLTLQPGEDTGLHTHPVPAFGYILEGELTVSYDGQESRTYKAGDAVLEAMSVAHNGRNSGTSPMRILAVFVGSSEQSLSVPAPTSK